MSFKINSGKGFLLTFTNGYSISTQIGYGNYCENYNNQKVSNMMSGTAYSLEIQSSNCEIAIFDKSNMWVTGEIIEKSKLDIENDGSVAGNVSFDKWFKLISFIESL